MSLPETDLIRMRIERHRKHLDYSRRLITALEAKDQGREQEAHEMLTAFIEDYQKDPAAWDGLVSPTDAVRFLSTEVNALRRKLPK